MKAYLLAAGLGTRLRPLTDTIPKCLVPVAGKPLLEWWMELFRKHGVTDVLINTHHHRAQVKDFISKHNTDGKRPRLYEFYENKLAGSGGTVMANKDFVAGEEEFFICYADNLTQIDLTALEEYHKTHDGILTMALFNSEVPEQCGIALTDENGKIIEFEEKPSRPKSNLANAGIYVTTQEIFRYIPDLPLVDFGKDVLPSLIGKMYGYAVDCFHLDIGTPENLYRAEDEWTNDNF
jgi:mannose-1-phosphate guanylyltransferase